MPTCKGFSQIHFVMQISAVSTQTQINTDNFLNSLLIMSNIYTEIKKTVAK